MGTSRISIIDEHCVFLLSPKTTTLWLVPLDTQTPSNSATIRRAVRPISFFGTRLVCSRKMVKIENGTRSLRGWFLVVDNAVGDERTRGGKNDFPTGQNGVNAVVGWVYIGGRPGSLGGLSFPRPPQKKKQFIKISYI